MLMPTSLPRIARDIAVEGPAVTRYRPTVIYQHPLAYLIGLEGLALMRAWGGDFDEQFVRARLA